MPRNTSGVNWYALILDFRFLTGTSPPIRTQRNRGRTRTRGRLDVRVQLANEPCEGDSTVAFDGCGGCGHIPPSRPSMTRPARLKQLPGWSLSQHSAAACN